MQTNNIIAIQPEEKGSLDVIFQEAVTLDIDVPVFMVQYGKEEIKKYVEEISKPELKTYTDNLSDNFKKQATIKLQEIGNLSQSAMQSSQSALESKDKAEQSLSEVTSLVGSADSLVKQVQSSAESLVKQAQSWAVGDINTQPLGSAKYWAEKIKPEDLIQTGTIILSPLASMNGYLLCNGATVSRTTYKNLFSVLGTKYGAGDEKTTFHLPDFRGIFIQGYKSGFTSAIGHKQPEALPNITGYPLVLGIDSANVGVKGAVVFEKNGDGLAFGSQTYERIGKLDASKASSVYGRSSHVVPNNHALHFQIKY